MKSLTFKKFSIEALGPFKYAHTIDLETTENKPMLLVEGMNGCGKTTFLLSLQIALFGKKLFAKSEKKVYESLIKDLSRKDVLTNPRLCAEFAFNDASGHHIYRIARTWDLQKTFREHVVIWKDGHPTAMTVEEWDELVDSYLPAELADMFFFDGEKIEQMANPNRLPAILKKATEAFLGIHEIDTLFNDTVAFERRAIARLKADDSDTDTDLDEFHQLQEEVKDLESRIEIENLNIASKQNDYDLAQKQFDTFKAEADRKGLAMYEQSVSLRSKFEAISQELNQAKAKLVEAVANQYLPFSRLTNLLKNLYVQHENEANASNAVATQKALQAHDERLMAALLEALPLSSYVIEDVFKKEQKSYEHGMNIQNILVPMMANETLQEKITQAVHARDEAKAAVEQLEDKLTIIQKAIDSIPPEEQVQMILQEENQMQTMVMNSKLELEFTKEKIEQLEGKLVRVKQHMNVVEDRLRSSYKGNAKIKAALEASKRVRSVLTIYKDRLLAHKANWLSQSITSHYKRLMRKQALIDAVKIDPNTYDVTVKLRSGDALPMPRLSAGERQLLATAVLSALIGERSCSFPVVVDTPLARLDKSHRSSMVNNFYSTVSHQVMVLSTDEEISGKLKEETTRYICRGYRFVYDDVEQCTNIEEMVL